MADRLVDTDVLIDHLRGHRALAPPFPVAYSVITRCELYSGRLGDEDRIDALLAPMQELPVDRATAALAGRWRRGHRVRTRDALIGATAVRHELDLLTRNRRDFERLPGLTLVGEA